MFQPRALSRVIAKAIRTFPAVVLTGPRQSGKTTLLRELFSKTHSFVSLENPDVRLRAREDPVGFLRQHRSPAVFDEIQYVPELLPYVKTRIDENRKAGQWLFTGSQNFALMQGVTESLAGRAAVLSLLPFSYAERIGRGSQTASLSQWLTGLRGSSDRRGGTRRKVALSEWILRGGFPELASRKRVDRSLWCGSYITTYLERDVRSLANVGDLNQFERFLRLCAVRTAQLLNLSEMAREIGVSVPTAKRWLSVLEAGYQVYLLYPYYRNIGKRFVKSPKLYFTDTALASYLLGIHEGVTLENSPSFGALFETAVVCDVLKRFLHSGELPSLYYLKSRDGLEVDLVIEKAGKLHLFEIKSTATLTPKHAASLLRLSGEKGATVASAAILSRARDRFVTGKIINWHWENALSL